MKIYLLLLIIISHDVINSKSMLKIDLPHLQCSFDENNTYVFNVTLRDTMKSAYNRNNTFELYSKRLISSERNWQEFNQCTKYLQSIQCTSRWLYNRVNTFDLDDIAFKLIAASGRTNYSQFYFNGNAISTWSANKHGYYCFHDHGVQKIYSTMVESNQANLHWYIYKHDYQFAPRILMVIKLVTIEAWSTNTTIDTEEHHSHQQYKIDESYCQKNNKISSGSYLSECTYDIFGLESCTQYKICIELNYVFELLKPKCVTMKTNCSHNENITKSMVVIIIVMTCIIIVILVLVCQKVLFSYKEYTKTRVQPRLMERIPEKIPSMQPEEEEYDVINI